MSLDNVLSEVAGSVPECLAIGYVDAASGMLLAIRTVDSHPREVIDLVAAATADLFNGPNVSMIESLFKKSRGLKDDGHHYFQELIVQRQPHPRLPARQADARLRGRLRLPPNGQPGHGLDQGPDGHAED
jgi:hypothetical protein